ncbi:hypothetical protein FTO70_01475 [Methanosarcina sp. KYL-1]|uniref:hypothetical protein n=1 Tax=Methanosarcina sp. KYL-1 TaxID=2602068 RepID=UPI002101AB14|nr:hypothetical protein [Methanosarcina sp. KYL-1]MCQ1534387.1 hypothetical protein [Methanosarcina sp. KYL-1]
MHKTLNLDELIAKKQAEKEKKSADEGAEIEELFDLIIPPGTLVSVIYDLVEEFELEPVKRKIFVGVANSEERELLALRGPLEKVQAAEKFLYKEMKAWVDE